VKEAGPTIPDFAPQEVVTGLTTIPVVEPPPSAKPSQTPPIVVTAPPVVSVVTGMSAQEIEETILALVSEKTGYERELLDLDLDLEADLGIDTIKQAQVIALMREEYRLPLEQGLKIKDFPTLRRVISYVAKRVGAVAPAEGRQNTGLLQTATAEANSKLGIRRFCVT